MRSRAGHFRQISVRVSALRLLRLPTECLLIMLLTTLRYYQKYATRLGVVCNQKYWEENHEWHEIIPLN